MFANQAENSKIKLSKSVSAVFISAGVALCAMNANAVTDKELEARLNAAQADNSNVEMTSASNTSVSVNQTAVTVNSSNVIRKSVGVIQDTPRVDGDQPRRKVKKKVKRKAVVKSKKSSVVGRGSQSRAQEEKLIESLNQTQINTGVSMRSVTPSVNDIAPAAVNIEADARQVVEEVQNATVDDTLIGPIVTPVESAVAELKTEAVNKVATDVSEFTPVAAAASATSAAAEKVSDKTDSIQARIAEAQAKNDEYVAELSEKIDAAKAESAALNTNLRTRVDGDTTIIAGEEAAILTIEDAKAAIEAQKK